MLTNLFFYYFIYFLNVWNNFHNFHEILIQNKIRIQYGQRITHILNLHNIMTCYLNVIISETMIIKIIICIVIAFSLAISSTIKNCDRRPSLTSGPKSKNSPPFRITFKGNSEFYLPKTTYTGN